MSESRNSRVARSQTSPWATCDYSSSSISSMASLAPNIDAMMAETQSNTESLFA